MIDNLIIFAYLVIVTYMGYSCRKLGGFREFAISHGNYGWLAVFCTLSATFIGGGFSTGNAAKVFTGGIAYSLALCGFSLQILLVALFIAPRVKAFPGALSVGDIREPASGRRARDDRCLRGAHLRGYSGRANRRFGSNLQRFSRTPRRCRECDRLRDRDAFSSTGVKGAYRDILRQLAALVTLGPAAEDSGRQAEAVD